MKVKPLKFQKWGQAGTLMANTAGGPVYVGKHDSGEGIWRGWWVRIGHTVMRTTTRADAKQLANDYHVKHVMEWMEGGRDDN